LFAPGTTVSGKSGESDRRRLRQAIYEMSSHSGCPVFPLFRKWMPVSGSGMSNQSRKLFSDLLQPLPLSFVEFYFELGVHVTCPIDAIGGLDF